MRRSRIAVATIFFVNGAAIASWLPHVPAIKARHALGDGQLGAVLLCMAAGSVIALPMAGWLVSRFGSRTTTAAAALILCAALPLPVTSPGVGWLAVALALVGASNGTLDVAMNTQAAAVERAHGRAIMSSFHGLFSLGGLVGAGLAGVAIAGGLSPERHVWLTAVVGALVVLATIPGLARPPACEECGGPRFARPTGALVTLGALAFLGLLAEGAMGDWSAVYLRDVLASSPALAAGGFAAFSLTMAAGRFGGDALVRRLGPERVLRLSGVVAAVGLGGALLAGRPVIAIAGCGAMGLGLANVIPILFSAAARAGASEPGIALAAVATTGYVGLLAGPPLIGLAAEVVGLAAALGIVVLSCTVLAAASAVVSRPGDSRPAATAEGLVEVA